MKDAGGLGQLTVSREGGKCLGGGPRRHRGGAELPGLLQPPPEPIVGIFHALVSKYGRDCRSQIQNNPSPHRRCFRPSQVVGGGWCYGGERLGL